MTMSLNCSSKKNSNYQRWVMSVLAAKKERCMKNQLIQITKIGASLRRSRTSHSLAVYRVTTDLYSKPAKEKYMLRLKNLPITCFFEYLNALVSD